MKRYITVLNDLLSPLSRSECVSHQSFREKPAHAGEVEGAFRKTPNGYAVYFLGGVGGFYGAALALTAHFLQSYFAPSDTPTQLALSAHPRLSQ
jgi:hypothetical protein